MHSLTLNYKTTHDLVYSQHQYKTIRFAETLEAHVK